MLREKQKKRQTSFLYTIVICIFVLLLLLFINTPNSYNVFVTGYFQGRLSY